MYSSNDYQSVTYETSSSSNYKSRANSGGSAGCEMGCSNCTHCRG